MREFHYTEREDGDELFMAPRQYKTGHQPIPVDDEGEEFPSGDTIAGWMSFWALVLGVAVLAAAFMGVLQWLS